MVGRVIEEFGSVGTFARRWTAAGAAAATFTALDAAAETVDDAGYNRQQNDGADDDAHDDGPFAVVFGHAFVPAGKGLGGLFDLVHGASRPYGLAGDGTHDGEALIEPVQSHYSLHTGQLTCSMYRWSL